mgnify:CR=1 FL=1
MKILNLYAGIGGNRKLWSDEHQITMVEINPEIARIYQDNFPKDKVVISDAHQYLLEHFSEFDFIWSSPPCPTHSRVRFIVTYGKNGKIRQKPVFPDMKLYEEIIFLKHYFRGKWCVENVVGYYKPLIIPQEMGKHYFWANFPIIQIDNKVRGHKYSIERLSKIKGFELGDIKGKRLLLRNCVEPELGKYILSCAINKVSLF